MTDEEVVRHLTKDGEEIKSLKHRVDKLEKQQEDIGKLTLSVNKLAVNMEYMVAEQKKQGERMEKIEREPTENAKYYKRLIIGNILTAFVAAVVGAIIGLVL